MSPRAAALLVVALLIAAAPAAGAREPRTPQPEPGANGMDTAMGRIAAPAHLRGGSAPVPWEANFTLTAGGAPGAALLLVAFIAANPSVRPWLESVEDASGARLPIAPGQDHRERGASESKVFIDAYHVRPGEEIRLRGTVEVSENGRNHVGALVIAFDREWRKVVAPDGRYAQLYAYGFVGATSFAASALDPPFQGQGNPVPFPVVAIILALPALGFGAWHWWDRRGQARRS